MTDLEKLKTDALGFPEQAKKIIVHNDETLNLANDFVKGVKKMIKVVSESYDPIIRHAKAEKKKYIDPLIRAEQISKLNIGAYLERQAEIQRKAEEEARKKEEERQKEEQRILDEAKIIKDSGKTEEAEAMIEEIPLPPQPAEHAAPEALGLTVKKILDTERINNIVEQCKERTKIPGIEVYPIYKWKIIDRKLIPGGYYKSSVASRTTKVETEIVTQGKPEDA